MFLAIIVSIAINIVITLLIVGFALKVYSDFLAKLLTDTEERFDNKLDLLSKIENLRKNNFNE